MIAMQYRFDFPEGTDMTAIHRRASDKGPGFDGIAGLEQKAFLVADDALDQPNRYAPFYLWRSPTGMREFLLSEAFAALGQAFGRPEVVTWTVLRFRTFDTTRPPLFATQDFTAVPSDGGTQMLHELALNANRPHPGLHSALVAVDPRRWLTTRLSLWHRQPAPAVGADRYHVPYLATRR